MHEETPPTTRRSSPTASSRANLLAHAFFLRHDTRAIGQLRLLTRHGPSTLGPRLRVGEFPGWSGYEIHLGVPRAYVPGAHSTLVLSSSRTEMVVIIQERPEAHGTTHRHPP